jgi:hypothetical protein
MDDPPKEAGRGEIYGIATVYDAVGHVVATDLPLKESVIRGMYGIYWNLRNENKRTVGCGTYLIMITLHPENISKATTMKIKVGVTK